MADETTYWSRTLHRRVGRRAIIIAGGVSTLSFAAACSGSNNNKNSSKAVASAPPAGAAASAPASGSAAAAAASPGAAVGGTNKIVEQYLGQYGWQNLQKLAGQSAGPKIGGTYRFSNSPGVTGWDFTGPEADTLASFAPHHYNGLVSWKMDDYANAATVRPLIGDLATSWEQSDPQTITFKLNQGVKFHNIDPVKGREMTAEDVKYSFTVFSGKQDPKKALAQQPIFAEVDKIDAPDKYTVVLKFAKPAAYFLGSLQYPVALVFPRELYEKPDLFAKQPIGTGPYTMEKWDPPNVYVGKKFADYFGKDPRTSKQLPFNDGFEAPMLLGNHPEEGAAFRAGKLDVYWAQGKADFEQMLKSVKGSVGELIVPPPSFLPYFALKLDKPPFTDVRVRNALQMAINMPQIIDKIAEGVSDPAYAQDYSFFGRERPWSLEELDKMGGHYTYNPDKAKALLAEAGAKDLKMKVLIGNVVPVHYEFAKAAADYWRAIGVNVTLDEFGVTDLTRWSTALFSKQWGDLDGILASFAGPGMEPDAFSHKLLNSKSTGNLYWINDSQIDDLTEKQRRELDVEKRKPILLDIMRRDLDQSYRIWGIHQYKWNVRQSYAFNVVDNIFAWSNIGWGCKSDAYVWFNR